eukprot:4774294-Pyramimonas_sp.AAC.1
MNIHNPLCHIRAYIIRAPGARPWVHFGGCCHRPVGYLGAQCNTSWGMTMGPFGTAAGSLGSAMGHGCMTTGFRKP